MFQSKFSQEALLFKEGLIIDYNIKLDIIVTGPACAAS